MKWLLLCLLMLTFHVLAAQNTKDSSNYVTVKAGLGINGKEKKAHEIKLFADSINKYSGGTIPSFLLNSCFDWQPYYWKDMHSAVSLRWIILKKVHNRKALKKLLHTNNNKLKDLCSHRSDKVYPYLSVPMINKSFYQLILKRYKEL
jgi:hypothetical protein